MSGTAYTEAANELHGLKAMRPESRTKDYWGRFFKAKQKFGIREAQCICVTCTNSGTCPAYDMYRTYVECNFWEEKTE